MRQIPESAICELFETLPDWTLLRNADVFCNFRRGGDCDILIADIHAGEAAVRKLLGEPVRTARRSYVLSLYYPWGHIDLTDHYYWRGLRLISGKEILASSSHRGVWPVVSEIHEAVFLLLNSLLWGGFVKTRYVDVISDIFAREHEAVAAVLESMIGIRASTKILLHVRGKDWPELEKSTRSLRRATFTFHFTQKPLRSIFGQIHFYYREILLRIRPNLPEMVLVVNENIDVMLIKPLILETAGSFEYKCLIEDRTLGSSSGSSRFWTLNKRTFRARNGLIVRLVRNNSSVRDSKNRLRVSLEEATLEGVTQALIRFQEKASQLFE